jgi:hydrogenase expression/formation protein HypC
LEVSDTALGLRFGKVDFGGVARTVRLDFVPEAAVGDHVMVHVGFAISRVNAEEAERSRRLLEALALLGQEEKTLEEDAKTTR